MIHFKERLRKVKAFAFDVDGVLSNPKVYLLPGGEMVRSMNTKDGYALQHAARRGYPIAIITGATTESVGERFRRLGITDIHLGASYKMDCFTEFVRKYGIEMKDVLYMGDDLPDLEVMQASGVPCCPSDAVDEIKALSLYVSPLPGGEGCARDVIEQVLRLHGHWMDGDAFTW